jgi:hypothetical protein
MNLYPYTMIDSGIFINILKPIPLYQLRALSSIYFLSTIKKAVRE